MDADSSILSSFILLVALMLTNALFAMGETAVIGLNDARLHRMAEEGNPIALRLARLTEKPTRFLSTIQVGLTLSGTFAAALTAHRFAGFLAAALPAANLSANALHTITLVVTTLVLACLLLVFGTLVPRRIAAKYPEQTSFRLCGLLTFLFLLLCPLVWLLSAITNLVARLFGVSPEDDEEQITEEDIRMLVDVGEETGSIEETEREMINNIFEFDDRTVVEVMTHRTDMFAVNNDTDLDEFLTVAIQSGHSRIPVYQESVDDIVGILYVKDLLPLLQMDDHSGFDIQTAMRKPLFVPESTRCDDLFRQFTAKKLHMAVVADEYGGTAGIVTMEDLVESILGSIQDEYDHEEEEAEQLSEDLFVLDGSLTLDETERLLDIELTDDTDYETIGGLLVERLDQIPAPDQHPEVELSG
ncbi:MAG: HlyC/CorC family transporter, partial [Oscillospiraceae bacterium]|nr:HlyC/CorC family transporter [Oscillospiraceae bacterium]